MNSATHKSLPLLESKTKIEVVGLSKSYGKSKVVDEISFTAGAGETTILLGTSGSGKTTTLKMINRLVEPDGGNVYIDSKPIAGLNPVLLRRGIGYVFQDTGLFPHLTVGENIAIIPKLLGWEKVRIKEKTISLLDHLGMEGLKYYSFYPDSLSGGQKQRVGFARALIASPPILLMDEPFGALDPITRSSVRADFKQIPELKEKCIIMVTHDIQEAFELGDKIIIMDQGKIQQEGDKKSLICNPTNEFVRNFLKNQFFNLQLEVRFLKDYFTYFSESALEGELVGNLLDEESFQIAFSLFSGQKRPEVLAVHSTKNQIRYTTFKQLISFLADPIQ